LKLALLLFLAGAIHAGNVRPGGLSVLWDPHYECRDVLEISTDGMKTWADIEGPYDLVLVRGLYVYRVPVPSFHKCALFRVRRWWGTPWINPVSKSPKR